jgi:3-oxoacyl-[acyl-carrier protein] reductase
MGHVFEMNVSPPQRVALVTGASGGLGRALVAEFARSGWQVAAGARSFSPPFESIVFPLPLDVTRVDEVDSAVENVVNHFGRIDALINNAGVTADAALAQMSEEDWDRVLDVNLKGAVHCCRAVARQMIRQREGHIINISSQSARRGPRGQANYAAAKAGLIGLTQSLAKELGSRNVRVNAIFPGVLPTKMTAKLTAEQMTEFAQANALGRIGNVEEVARFIAFLATTQNISGQVFALDSRIAPWT